MNDYGAVLSAAQGLQDRERMRLIETLWDSVPQNAESEFSEEWLCEIERRAAGLDSGCAVGIPWSDI